MPTVEYCQNNADGDTRDWLAGFDCTIEHRCLQRCGDCYRGPFLFVDGRVETGESHEAIMADAGVIEE